MTWAEATFGLGMVLMMCITTIIGLRMYFNYAKSTYEDDHDDT